jgi:hypothetical protein
MNSFFDNGTHSAEAPRMNKRILLPALVALTVGACATPYQKNFIGGGYSDKKIDESTYVVSFNGNGYASKERVWYFWI